MEPELLPCVEIMTSKNPDASIIWMHGLGADGHDFVPIVTKLNLKTGIRFIFPHAPMRPVTINMGTRMRAWFDVILLQSIDTQDRGGIYEAEKSIRRLIEHEEELGFSSKRIILAGFSQGGSIALCTGLCYPKQLAGILSLSSFLPLAEEVLTSASKENKNIPIFMAHGTKDSIVSINYGKSSYEALKHQGYKVEWFTYPMNHSVCEKEIADIATWIEHTLENVITR